MKPTDVTPLALMEALAAEAPAPKINGHQPAPRPQIGQQSRLLVDKWLRDAGIEYVEKQTGDRVIYSITCPFNPEHTGDANVTQFTSGAVSASCFHNSCLSNDWGAFRERIGRPDPQRHYDPPMQVRTAAQHYGEGTAASPLTPIPKFSAGELIDQYPHLRPALIDGLMREGETCNVISVSKAGKSWLSYGMLLSFVTGRPWLGKFPTAGGRALLIDNELHRDTLSFRLRTVAGAMGITPEEFRDRIEIWPLRGLSHDVNSVCAELRAIQPGDFGLVTLDAWYRALPDGADENSNGDVMRLYNVIDGAIERLRAAFVCIHHSSKGDQSGKRITDVGSGAGSQSRAADCHLVLREHEEPDCLVLAAALRSFAPVEPLVLRWTFPVWTPETTLDAAALKRPTTRQDERQEAKDREGCGEIVEALREHGSGTARDLRAWTTISGHDRMNRLLATMRKDGRLICRTITKRGNDTEEYALPEYLWPAEPVAKSTPTTKQPAKRRPKRPAKKDTA
jgi:hypothetical protein